MIENLQGIHETVNFRFNSNIKLYNNDECEDYPSHWHTPIEIIMPLENSYMVDCNGHNFNLSVGDILVICPGVMHHLYASKGRRIIFQAEISNINPFKELEAVLSIISPALLITPENSPTIYKDLHYYMMEIATEYINNISLSESAIYARLTEILVLIGRNHTENPSRFDVGISKQKEYIDKFMNICNYINVHCTEDLSLDKMAALAGYSKYHFTRLFKQFTNISFYKYINLKRIAIAEKLLVDPNISVTDVALQSGFTSLSAFIRMFKLVNNCTPSDFRSMYKSSCVSK